MNFENLILSKPDTKVKVMYVIHLYSTYGRQTQKRGTEVIRDPKGVGKRFAI